MKNWQSWAHTKWDCKYHVVIVPKYRKKVFFGERRKRIGEILRDLCGQKGLEVVEGHAMPDHIHMCLSIPPKFSVAPPLVFLKVKVPLEYTENFSVGVGVSQICISGVVVTV